MKRLIVCCDGTWNTAAQSVPTNVPQFYDAVAAVDGNGMVQRAYYHAGVGTGGRDRLRGGAFGFGLSKIVKAAYGIVVDNYLPGDELFFLGFSRGAFTARSTTGLIRNAGILRQEHRGRIDEAYALYRTREGPDAPAAVEFRRRYALADATPIRFVGVWDTVGALGVPNTGVPGLGWLAGLVNRRWAFHDVKLSSRVASAYQALSIDETRRPFEPTLWQPQSHADDQELEQVWFAGDHSDVGGGYANHGLADITLCWLMNRARHCGLAFKGDPGAPLDTGLAMSPLHNSRTGLFRLLAPFERQLGVVDPEHEASASTAVIRRNAGGYGPPGLIAYLAGPHRETPL